jgi:hypothetical protein
MQLNTSNVGQRAISFTPITSQSADTIPSVQAKDRWQNNNNTGSLPAETGRLNSSNTSNSTFSKNHTATVTVSTPAQTACPAPDIETLVDELIQDVLKDLEAGDLGILGNIATILENGLQNSEGELGKFLGTLLQNATQSLGGSSSSGGSFLESIIKGLFSDGGSGSFSTNSTTNSTGGFNAFFKGILGNFSQGIATGLTKAEGEAAQGLTEALGIQQFYSLHLREVCTGNLSSPSDPQAIFKITGCLSYSDATTGMYSTLAIIMA